MASTQRPKTREDAKARGAKIYYPDTPCPNCNTGQRYAVNRACVHCTTERAKARYRRLKAEGRKRVNG